MHACTQIFTYSSNLSARRIALRTSIIRQLLGADRQQAIAGPALAGKDHLDY
jgi:hypothetical protein